MMNTKKILSSKTVWLAIFQGMIGIFTAIASTPDLQGVGWILIVKSILDIYLRKISSTIIK